MHGAGGWTGSQQHSHNTQGKSQLWAFPQGERRGKESLENPAASRLKARGENCPWMGPVQVGTAGQSWEDLPVSTATANPWLGHLCHLPGHREGAGTPRKWHSKGMAALIPSALPAGTHSTWNLLLPKVPGKCPMVIPAPWQKLARLLSWFRANFGGYFKMWSL